MIILEKAKKKNRDRSVADWETTGGVKLKLTSNRQKGTLRYNGDF